MRDSKIKLVLIIISIILFISLIVKLTKVPGGLILSGLYLGGMLLVGILIVGLAIALILRLLLKKYSFLTIYFFIISIAFIGYHYYLYSPTLRIIVPKGYTGEVNLVLSTVPQNILMLDSNGIGYLNKWTFDKTYTQPIVVETDGKQINSQCVGFNPSTFWAYSKFCCVDGKIIKSISFEIKRNQEEQNQFYGKGFAQYVDTKKLYE